MARIKSTPWRWPHEWSKHVAGIRSVYYTFMHLRALVGFDYHISFISARLWKIKTESNYCLKTSIRSFQKTHYVCVTKGARGGAVGWGTALQAGRPRVRFPMVSLEIFIDIMLPERLRCSRGSVLAFSTQVRGFKPGRNRRIFRAKKSSARLRSEGK